MFEQMQTLITTISNLQTQGSNNNGSNNYQSSGTYNRG